MIQQSIEEKILSLHHDKRELADRVLEDSKSASAFGVRELLDLLQTEPTGAAAGIALAHPG